ncbi:hypothetical protein T265_00145 [Opisthorchis viverrini]|uniref:Uncharacterized protein n=1 Tax=Opisthorchis viverrini TaxID=6198 RepID=A0A075A4K1_OPIVI|nr:hypothetical protein T265_00145 [Opisthorchis viverrini]KER34301.1 hypothetical protein T265_00145 [Opisthorchis viverrini]
MTFIPSPVSEVSGKPRILVNAPGSKLVKTMRSIYKANMPALDLGVRSVVKSVMYPKRMGSEACFHIIARDSLTKVPSEKR